MSRTVDMVESFLADLEAMDIRLRVEGGRLAYSAPPGAFTDALKQRVKDLRPELLTRLGNADAPVAAPLSCGQERMWFLNRLECQGGGGSGLYTEHLVLALDGPLDRPALAGALSALVARHGALRTLFREGPEGPEQVVFPPAPLELEAVDLAGAPQAACDRTLEAAAHRPVDLATDAHVRFTLLALASERHILSVSAHHAAWDGWSNGVFTEDLAIAYNALHAGRAPQWPALECDVAGLARAQRAALAGSGLADSVERWRRVLEGYPVRLDLPADRPRPASADGSGDTLEIRIPSELVAALTAAGRREGATLYMTVLAAWALLLSRLSGAPRLLIGTPVATREGSAQEALIGYLSNTLAIPVDTGAAASLGALVRQVRDHVLEAMAGQRVPFEKLVETLAPARTPATTPLVQTVFALQPRPVTPPALDGLRVSILPFHNQAARYELMLNLETAADGALVGPLTFATSRFDRARVTGWASQFLGILRDAPATWDAPFKADDFATPTERALAAIWAEFLQTAPAGRDDDFFLLGGHSLLLMRLLNRVKSSGLGEISLAEALASTRLADMAARIDGTAVQAEELPATAAQEGIWLARRDDPETTAWSAPVLIELPVGTTAATVRQALRQLAARHPALRTTFLERDGAVLQRVSPPGEPELTVHGALDAAIMRRELASPFDPERGPLYRFHLFAGESPVLFVVADHMGIDGWSVDVLRRDLNTFIAGGVPEPAGKGEETESAPLPDDGPYWRETLRGFDAGDPIAPGQRPPTAKRRGRKMLREFPAAALKALDSIARQGGTTASVAWIAAAGALMARLKGQARDISVGTPLAGRLRPYHADVVGSFAQVLPLRLSAALDQPFSTHLTATRRALIGALSHQNYSLSRGGGPVNLFDVVAVLEEADPHVRDWFDPQVGAGRYDLGFTLGRLTGGAVLTVEYDEFLYGETEAHALAARLESLLMDAAARPDAAIGDLAILPEAEFRLVTETFNPAATPYPRDASMAELWQDAVARHSGRAALRDRHGATLTYAELDRRAEAIAARLLAAGEPGPSVGLSVARGFDAIAAILGIWKAGAAYLPLDPKMPAAMIAGLASDAGARLFIADEPGAARLAGIEGITTLPVEAPPATQHHAVSHVVRHGGDPAYIMFTSGTTGTPKGVVVPHRGIARLAFNRDVLAVGPGDVLAQAAPLAFDATTFELWSALLNGAPLRIIGDEELLDPAALGAALREAGVTVMFLTAGLLCRAADEAPGIFSGLRLLATGGETLSPPHARRVLEASPGLCLANGYGPTENACLTTLHVVAPSELDGPVPIGRPIANSRVYIVDERLRPLPPGYWGELVCAGDGLASGYAGRPDLTSAAFVNLSWGSGERVYRTGDIARWRADGAIEFAGRRDGQVKIRGHRIETGAIEAVLAGCPGVRDAAVLAVGEGPEKSLVACVAADKAEEAAWRRRIAEVLPIYMMPARFVLVSSLPLNANGKHDRRSLAVMVSAKPQPAPAADYALSPGQERLWVMQQLFPASAVYNVPLLLEITGRFDTAAFARALTALEERHHALRLRVVKSDGHPRQRLEPSGRLVPEVIEAADAAAADARIASEVERPFQLDREAGARAVLLRLAADRWRILLVFHHAVVDGWSLGILVRDLAALYGGQANLPPAPVWQFEEVAARQRDFAESAQGQALLARWRQRLTPLPEALALPLDHLRPAIRSFRGDLADFTFDPARSAALERLAREESATPFAVAAALVQTLLHRLTGQRDLALGTLVAGRTRPEVQDTVGFLVNTVVLRQAVDPAESFRRHLARTRATCLEAIADEDCPFESLVEAVGAPRDLGRNPLFDVLVVWQSQAAAPAVLPGATLSSLPPRFPFAKFDLGFHFERRGDRIACQIEYSTDLFDAETIAALFRRLDALAAAALADPDQRVGALPVMSAAERALVVEQFNATAMPLDTRRSIIRPLLDRVAAAPSAPAVLGEAPLDYRTFAARAAGVARRLQEAGVRPGDTVAVCAPRSPELLIGIYGILMAGAAYAPLGADDPAGRLAGMLEDLGRPLVLAAADCRAKVEAAASRVLELAGAGEAAPLDLGSPDGLAYVLFTSGSTGRPKGVQVEQHAVLNRILWMQSAFPIGPGDVILQKTPVTFDVSVWELFWWAWTGAGVMLPPPGAERDPLALVDLIDRHGVTVLHFVPSMLAPFLTCLEDGRADARRLRRLRYVFASGEALDARLVERFERLLHKPFGTQLHNLYGPTEATVDVTWHCCSPWAGGDVVPIGRPIANTTVYILDGEGNPTPIGVAGEIHLGGPQVARGYCNRPELTAEKFIPDPFRQGGRLYRTGDAGRWRRDGAIEYLGRQDQQVKVRGQRIEPGEVEHALETHPAVERAVVIAAMAQGITELHAYVLARAEVTAAALRGHLRDRVTDAMVPARFFRTDTLPLTSSGKLDRKALHGTPLEQAEAQPAATLSAVEAEVQAIWKSVLPDAAAGARDGFFESGGNSLLVISLHEKLNARWPGVFGIADLFACATIAEQARRIAPPAAAAVADPMPAASTARKEGGIAVVGMAVRLPGSDDLESFWRDVAAGADRVRPLPPEREADARTLLAALGVHAPERFREAAYLDDVLGFDFRRLRLSPADAALLDPEQRLFLDTAVRALDDAGRGGASLDSARVGVFVGGAANTAWREVLMRSTPERAEQVFALNVPSNIATRLSFLHNWRGPAAVIDTACSSALVAVHNACRALRAGECEWALAGGAKILLTPPPDGQRMTIDSSTGRTRAFAEGADGTGMGEGGIVFLLRRLDDALAEGDPIHGAILGSAVNQDGASSGMAAPNPAAQAEVIAAAARDAGVALPSLSYIEAHGTGTALGDPVEIDGLTRAFSAETAETGFAAIGSGKGNYGHLDGAAGALGLARALLCVAHDSAPPQPFFQAPNPRIDFARAPVAVRRSLGPLAERGVRRRAGISAFGLSGINAHVVIEAPPPRVPESRTLAGWFAVGLSAPDAASLRRYAGAVVAELRRHPETPLDEIVHTLTEGRDLLESRLAVWVRDRGDLMARLAVFAAAPDAVDGLVLTGSAGAGREPLPAVHEKEEGAAAAAAAFVAGARLLWPREDRCGRVHLPAAPLDRRRCAPRLAPAPLAEQRPAGLLGPAAITAQGRFYPVDVHAESFWPAAQHLLEGAPTLVGMGFPALLAETSPGQAVHIRRIRWIQPLRPAELEQGTVTLSLTPEGAATLSGRTTDGRWLTFATAAVETPSSLGTLDLTALAARFDAPVAAPPFVGRNGVVEVGEPWNCLERTARGKNEALGWLRLPAGGGLHLHPGLLDVASGLALVEDGLVPAGCESIEFAGTLPADPLAHVSWHATDTGMEADVRLADRTSGEIAAVLRGLRFARLGPWRPPAGIVPSQPVWEPAPLDACEPGGPVVVIGEGAVADRMAAYLAAAGRLAARSGSHEVTPEAAARIGAQDAPAIVFAPAAGADAAPAMRAVLAALRGPARLLALGEGAFAVGDAGPLDALQALTYGVVVAAAREETLLKARYIDTDGQTAPASLLAELTALEGSRAAIAWRDGRRLARRFVPVAAGRQEAAWPTEGCCVVSGGTGGLSLLLAETLAAGGAVSLALLSRAGEPRPEQADAEARRRKLEELRAAGLRIQVYACDIGDRAALAATLDRVRQELGPITAVVHNAGLPDGAYLASGDPRVNAYAASLHGKVHGARLLDELTAADPVRAFVMAGSLTSLVGEAGHAAYTGGNAFLDAFAAERRRRGQPAITIDWCGIHGMGMAHRALQGQSQEFQVSVADVGPLFRQALASGAPQVAILIPPVQKDLETAEVKPEAAPARSAGGALETAIAAVWAEVLGYDSVKPDADFYELGGDSLAGARIAGQIVRDLGHPMTLADLLETGTAAKLAERLRGRAARPQSAAPAPARTRYPVAWEQLAVLRAEEAGDMGTAYNLPSGLELPADIDLDRLRSAANELVARYEILRTRFIRPEGEGDPEMEILPPAPVVFEEAELPAGLADCVRPFDLWSGVPVRFTLGRVDGRPRALVLDVHHALADAFTMELLLAELTALYQGTAGPAPSAHLKDYAWRSRAEDSSAPARAYWLDRFRGPLPKLDLPSDRPRPLNQTRQVDTVEFAVASATVEQLRAFAAERRTTPFTVVTAAWALLLSRYARTSDLVIAAPVDSREAAGMAGMAGMLVSLLPLRLSIPKDGTLADFLQQAHRVHAEAQRHRSYSLGRLLAELAPPAEPGRAFLSEATLSYMNFAEEAGGNGFPSFSLPRRDGKGDLAIFVRDLPARMEMTLEYDTGIFDRDRIERMSCHLRTLLDALVSSAPDRPLSSLPLVDAEEAAWLERVGQGGDPRLPSATGLFGVFAQRAAASPEAVALEGSGVSLTYAELLRRASGIAARLAEAGVAHGDRVALHVERDAHAIVLLLGIVGAGAAYVPLDPAWPAERVGLVLEGCRVAIADAAGRAVLPFGARVLDAESMLDTLADDVPLPPASVPAYVMYTSGSTGTPKGVVVPQAAVLRLALGGGEIAVLPQDRVVQAGPLAFDASTFEIWAALLNGARVIVASREETLDPDALASALRHADVLWLTTALFNRQVEAAPESFKGLRLVITGGEAMSGAHAARAIQACPGVAFFNGYGPTENTTFTAVHRVTPADTQRGGVPIGHPIPGTWVAVLEPNGAPAPIGVWGEIVTGGAGLAEGYLNRQDLTAECFTTGPGGRRMYRTGDLGRWRTDGVLEFGGRRDGQIKLRGYRIELEEIEQALNRHPNVAASAALFLREGDGEGIIVACIQPRGEPPAVSTLQQWLFRKLPAYMAPRRFVMMPDLPVNSNGKLDRARLAATLPAETGTAVAGEPPRDGAERLVADCFAGVFGVPVEDRQASFFDLGGHSLLAIQVVNRIAQATGVRISMRDFFKAPTVAGLAALAGGGEGAGEAIVRVPEAPSYPASHSQARLYLAGRMSGSADAGAYNITFALPFSGALDRAALASALRELALRHEPLRTGFAEEDGRIVQRIAAEAVPELMVDDVSSAADPQAEALRLARREAATTFDLDRPPLLRARAIRVSAEDELWVVLLVLHHIAGDGWSTRILLRELELLYRAAQQGRAAALPALPVAYRDFAVWQSRCDWTASAQYWQETLAGAPQRIEIPADRPAPAVQSHRGDTLRRTLPPELAGRLAEYSREHGTTVGTVGLALLATLLYRLTRQQDMVIGMGVTGRDRAEVEGLIGFFVNVVPLRLRVGEDTDFGVLVDQVHSGILAALDHRDYPFDLLVRAVAARRAANRQPLINVVFEYQHFEDLDGPDAGGVFGAGGAADAEFGKALEEAIHTPTAKHDLLLFFTERRQACELTLEYDTDLLDRSTAERWLGYLEQFARMLTSREQEDTVS